MPPPPGVQSSSQISESQQSIKASFYEATQPETAITERKNTSRLLSSKHICPYSSLKPPLRCRGQVNTQDPPNKLKKCLQKLINHQHSIQKNVTPRSIIHDGLPEIAGGTTVPTGMYTYIQGTYTYVCMYIFVLMFVSLYVRTMQT